MIIQTGATVAALRATTALALGLESYSVATSWVATDDSPPSATPAGR